MGGFWDPILIASRAPGDYNRCLVLGLFSVFFLKSFCYDLDVWGYKNKHAAREGSQKTTSHRSSNCHEFRIQFYGFVVAWGTLL